MDPKIGFNRGYVGAPSTTCFSMLGGEDILAFQQEKFVSLPKEETYLLNLFPYKDFILRSSSKQNFQNFLRKSGLSLVFA